MSGISFAFPTACQPAEICDDVKIREAQRPRFGPISVTCQLNEVDDIDPDAELREEKDDRPFTSALNAANTWCSYESWTLYDYDSELPRPPNRLSHELGQEQMRIFARKLEEHQRFFKKHILEKRSEQDEQPASCMPRFISKYKYFLSSAK
eukprot:symbB.v1.2.030141.t1/scaffold3365.1/size58364/7